MSAEGDVTLYRLGGAQRTLPDGILGSATEIWAYGGRDHATVGLPLAGVYIDDVRIVAVDTLPLPSVVDFEGENSNPFTGGTVTTGGTQTREGKIVFASPDLVKSLEDILDIPNSYTITETQQMTGRLFDAIGNDTIIPGINARNARLLYKAATRGYDDIADDSLRGVVGQFRDKYKGAIRKFDKAIIQRIMKDPKYAGRIEPEAVVGAIFKKGETANLLRVKKVVTPGTWKRIQQSAMEEVLGKISKRTTDPFTEVFDGKGFLDALDLYGETTLGAVFGRGKVKELYRLGRVTQLVTLRASMSGGLVAASIALHPLKNMGKLMRFRVLGHLLRTPFAVRWLTEGLKAPKTRAGSMAITRLGVFIKALADEHTQDPNLAAQLPPGVKADKN